MIFDKLKFDMEMDFKKATFLGGGSFGKVYKCQSFRDNKYYALKKVETNKMQENKWALDEYLRQKEICAHSNIISVFKAFQWVEPPNVYVLMIQMEIGDNNLQEELTNIKKQNKWFQEKELDKMFIECLDALYYMANKKRVYHRDIKPENILLKNKEVKITDFGCSKHIIDKKMTVMTLVGTPYFLSPKLWDGFSSNQVNRIVHDIEKSDIFSLGLTFLQCAAQVDLFQLGGLNAKGKESQKKLGSLLIQVKSKTHQDMIKDMLVYDEQKRFDYKQLIQKYYPSILNHHKYSEIVQNDNNNNNQGVNMCQQHSLLKIKYICIQNQQLLCEQCYEEEIQKNKKKNQSKKYIDDQDEQEIIEIKQLITKIQVQKLSVGNIKELRNQMNTEIQSCVSKNQYSIQSLIQKNIDNIIKRVSTQIKQKGQQLIKENENKFTQAKTMIKQLEQALFDDQSNLDKQITEFLKNQNDLNKLQQVIQTDENLSSKKFKEYEQQMKIINSKIGLNLDQTNIQAEEENRLQQFTEQTNRNLLSFFKDFEYDSDLDQLNQKENSNKEKSNSDTKPSNNSNKSPLYNNQQQIQLNFKNINQDILQLQTDVKFNDIISQIYFAHGIFLLSTKNRRLQRRFPKDQNNYPDQVVTTTDIIRSLEYMPASKIVLAGGDSGQIRLLDAINLNQLKVLNGPGGYQTQKIKFFKQNDFVVSSGSDRNILIFQLYRNLDQVSYIEIVKYDLHRSRVMDFEFIKNDILVSSGYDRQLILYNVQTKQSQKIQDIHSNVVTKIIKIDQFIITASLDGKIKMWELDFTQIQNNIPYPLRVFELQTEIENLIFIKEYEIFVTLSNNSKFYIIKAKTGQIHSQIAYDNGLPKIIPLLAGDSSTLYTTDCFDMKKWQFDKNHIFIKMIKENQKNVPQQQCSCSVF